MTAPQASEPSIAAVGLKGLCPCCGARALFDGLLAFAPACPACGLDLSAFNVGDGPAALITLAVGGLICAAAIVLELSLHPPAWVHVLIWLPVTLLLVTGALRVSKALLLASEYRHRAREGRLVERKP